MTVTGISAVWLKRGTIEKKLAHMPRYCHHRESPAQTRISSKLIFNSSFRRMLNWGCVFSRILGTYFRETTSPGLLVYEEFIVADKPLDRNARREVSQEIERAHKLMLKMLPLKSL